MEAHGGNTMGYWNSQDIVSIYEGGLVRCYSNEFDRWLLLRPFQEIRIYFAIDEARREDFKYRGDGIDLQHSLVGEVHGYGRDISDVVIVVMGEQDSL